MLTNCTYNQTADEIFQAAREAQDQLMTKQFESSMKHPRARRLMDRLFFASHAEEITEALTQLKLEHGVI